jgi:hypothetical protein
MSEAEVVTLREQLSKELTYPGFDPLARRLYDKMSAGVGRLLHLEKLPALALSVVIVFGLSLLVGFLIELVTGTLQSIPSVVVAGQFLSAFGTALIPLDAQWYAAHISRSLREYIVPKIVSLDNLADLQKWLSSANRLAPQVLFSLVLATVATLITALSLSDVFGGDIGIGAVIVVFIGFFQIGTAISFRINEITLYRRLSQYQLDLYEPNPSQSAVMLALYRMVTIPIYLVGSTMAVITIFSVITTGIQSVFISIVGVVWVSMIAAYIVSQRLLSQIIMRSKQASKTEIARRVKELSTRLVDESARNETQWLMNYHDRIVSSPDSMVNIRSASNFILALLLPAIIVVIQVVITEIVKRLL